MAVAAWLAAGCPAGAQAKDKAPEQQVVESLEAAVNAGKVADASALFADDAVVTAPESATASGRAQIDAWLQSLASGAWRMDSGNRQVSEGGRVTGPTSISNEGARRLGVAPLDGFVEAVVLGGKIRSLTVRFSAAAQLRLTQAKAKADETVARSLVEGVIGKGDLSRADMLLAGTFIDHDPAPGKTGDAAGFKAGVTDLRAAFPDLACAIEDVLVAGGRVAVRGVCTGTQQGQFMGLPPSGRAFRAGFIEFFRIADGRITERWGSRDAMKMVDQLGLAVVAPAAAPAVAPTATTTGKPAATPAAAPGAKPGEKPKDKKSGWF